jgi:arylformamidase
MTRRQLLGTSVAAATAVAPAFGQALQTYLPPGEVPKPRGPRVFLDYDQAELDAAYDQARWVTNQAELAKRNAQKSTAVLARLGAPRRLAYGPTGAEQLDWYATGRPNAPLHVWIHGGAWRAGRDADAAYIAEMFVDAGAHFIALDFNNVLETKGDLLKVAQQVRRAVAWVYQNASRFGGDASRLYVSGHSSGGHLAAVVVTTDWKREFGITSPVVRGALCASGMYDLYPVSLSARNRYVSFTDQTVADLSPQRHLDRLDAPVIVAHGTLETPEFQRQAREFAAAVAAVGKSATLVVLDGYNHFDVAESLGNPYGVLGRAVLEQMEVRQVTSTAERSSLLQELQRTMGALAAARAAGDGDAWSQHVTAEFVVIHPDGRIHDRAQELAELNASSPGAVLVREAERYSWYGDDTVVYVSDFVSTRGQPVRAIEVWVRLGSSWKIAAAQVTRVGG